MILKAQYRAPMPCLCATLSKLEQIRFSDDFKGKIINLLNTKDELCRWSFITYIYHIYPASLSRLNRVYLRETWKFISYFPYKITWYYTPIICQNIDTTTVWTGDMLHDVVPYCNLLHRQIHVYHLCNYFAMTALEVQWWYTPFPAIIKEQNKSPNFFTGQNI